MIQALKKKALIRKIIIFSFVASILVLFLLILTRYLDKQARNRALEQLQGLQITKCPCRELCGLEYAFEQDLNTCCKSKSEASACKTKLLCKKQWKYKLEEQQMEDQNFLAVCWVIVYLMLTIFLYYLVYRFCCLCCIRPRVPLIPPARQIAPQQEQARLNLNRSSILFSSFLHSDLETECAICYETFQQEKAVRLKCNHIFHSHCIRKWMENKNNCPVCRSIQ